MTTTRYATLEDVLRQYDLDLQESDLGNEVKNTAVVKERFNSHLQSAESEFENQTENAFRPIRYGIPDSPATYAYHKGRGGGGSRNKPVNVYLDHMHIVPFDYNAGDRLQVRTGRDTWKDITDQEGTQWRANYQKGVIEVMRGVYGGTIGFRDDFARSSNEDAFRVTYRYGGTGGDPTSGGQTTLDTDISDTDTGNTAVDDVSRLPYGDNTFLVGNSEYIEATNDGSTFNITVRGVRGSTSAAHSSGDTIHYCPLDIREGIAAKAAMELLRQEDTLDILIESGDQLEVNARISILEDRWNSILMKYDNSMGYS